MIYLYLALIIGYSIYEITGLKKKKQVKEIFVFVGSMILVTVLGLVYLTDTYRPSITSYILEFFKIER
jgi:multisubunit Na+/H+ antiporter MnhB subunit